MHTVHMTWGGKSELKEQRPRSPYLGMLSVEWLASSLLYPKTLQSVSLSLRNARSRLMDDSASTPVTRSRQPVVQLRAGGDVVTVHSTYPLTGRSTVGSDG